MEDNLSDNDNLMQTQVDEETNVNDSDDNDVYNDVSDGGWIQWFCQMEGNEFFAEIDEEFLRNRSNIYGISKVVKNYKILLELILSPEAPTEEVLTEEYNEFIICRFMESVAQAKELYGLLHSRFITTSKGLALVREKYLNGVYGHCSRILCDKQILLPVGLSEDLKYSRVKVYCPKCEDIYKPRQKCGDIDGAFFGSSFPHVFLLTYPDLSPKLNPQKTYIPKLYGFRIFGKKGSKYYDYVKNAKNGTRECEKEDRSKLDDIVKKLNILNIS